MAKYSPHKTFTKINRAAYFSLSLVFPVTYFGNFLHRKPQTSYLPSHTVRVSPYLTGNCSPLNLNVCILSFPMLSHVTNHMHNTLYLKICQLKYPGSHWYNALFSMKWGKQGFCIFKFVELSYKNKDTPSVLFTFNNESTV